MIKFSSNSDFDFGIESVSAINDPNILIKRASVKSLLKVAKSKDQTDLHIIAVGAYEGTGFNRNGDMFRSNWCEKNAHYFKDSDRCVHRHHKNKPEDPKYGNVKAAAYNPQMKRIELVVGLDNNKCSDIIQEQEKVGHTNWSMASKQAYDVCTLCNHKAASDNDRCEHIPSQIGEITKEGQMIGMENPNPRWFEISYVRRPADRIGLSLSKVASAGGVKPMLTSDFLQIYTGFQEPSDDFFISKKAADKRHILGKCAEIEKHVAAVGKKLLSPVKTNTLSDNEMDEYRNLEPARFLKGAADNGIIFSPENFAKYLFGNRIKEASVRGMKQQLNSIFQELQKSGGDVVNNEKFEPSHLAHLSQSEKSLIKKIAMSHSLLPGFAKARLVNNLNSKIAKTADVVVNSFSKELAKQYIAYKLAALNYLDEHNKLNDELIFNCVLQNKE
jgi:hypothetical protein